LNSLVDPPIGKWFTDWQKYRIKRIKEVPVLCRKSEREAAEDGNYQQNDKNDGPFHIEKPVT